MADNKHIPVLDSLRAVAALSVCLFHFICTVTGFVTSETVLKVFSFGHFGVQMFFVISGFVIPWSLYHSGYVLRNYFTFTVKRFIRLEPPYILSLLLAITHTYMRMHSPYYNGVDITPTAKQVGLHFGYLIPFFPGEHWIRPVYWTLAVEFQYYLSIGLLFPLIANRKLGLRLLSYALMLSGPFLVRGGFLPHYLPVFLLGIIAFLYKTKIIGIIELGILFALACAEMLVFHGKGTLVFAVIPFIAILNFTNFKNKVLGFLGDISYSLYLFHSLTGLVLLNYFSHIVTNPVAKIGLVFLALGIAIGCSYIVYRFVELPSKRLSSKIKFKKAQKP